MEDFRPCVRCGPKQKAWPTFKQPEGMVCLKCLSDEYQAKSRVPHEPTRSV